MKRWIWGIVGLVIVVNITVLLITMTPGSKPVSANPAKTSPMVITARSVGPISIGMTKDAVITALGKPDQEDAGTYKYFGVGLEMLVSKSNGVRTIFAHARTPDSERKGFNNYEEFSGATDRGIKIGSPAQLVSTKYGELLEKRKQGVEESWVYRDPPITFGIRDGAVVLIMVHAPEK